MKGFGPRERHEASGEIISATITKSLCSPSGAVLLQPRSAAPTPGAHQTRKRPALTGVVNRIFSSARVMIFNAENLHRNGRHRRIAEDQLRRKIRDGKRRGASDLMRWHFCRADASGRTPCNFVEETAQTSIRLRVGNGVGLAGFSREISSLFPVDTPKFSR